MEKKWRRGARCAAALLFMTLLLLMTACAGNPSSPVDSGTQLPGSPDIREAGNQKRFTYLCFDASLSKYAAISEALAAECERQGVELSVIDCGGQDSVFFSVIDDLGQPATDALIVTAENNNLGPVVQEKCTSVSLPLLCIETRFRNAEGQSIVSVDYHSRECGVLLGSAVAELAQARGMDISDTSVIMLNVTSEVYIKQILSGVEDEFSKRLNISSANLTMLEVTGSSYEKQYLAMTSFFQKLDTERNYIFITFNNEGAKAVADYVRGSGADENRVILGSIGYFEEANGIFQTADELSRNFVTIDIPADSLVQSAMNLLLSHLGDLQEQPEVMIVPDQVITWESWKNGLFGE